MADEFYLPDEIIEWVGLKKGELLAWVLENRDEADIPFEEYEDFTEMVPEALQNADETWLQNWEGNKIQIQLKMFEEEQVYWLMVISLKVPVVNEQEIENDVLVPILIVPTKYTQWLKKWLSGEKLHTRHLH